MNDHCSFVTQTVHAIGLQAFDISRFGRDRQTRGSLRGQIAHQQKVAIAGATETKASSKARVAFKLHVIETVSHSHSLGIAFNATSDIGRRRERPYRQLQSIRQVNRGAGFALALLGVGSLRERHRGKQKQQSGLLERRHRRENVLHGLVLICPSISLSSVKTAGNFNSCKEVVLALLAWFSFPNNRGCLE